MNSAWHGNEDIMAEKVDYGTLKKGGFMRQKQKNKNYGDCYIQSP